MTNTTFNCRQCRRDTFKNLGNKCQYCGAALPEHMKMSEEEKEVFRQAQAKMKEEASGFASGMADEPEFVREEKRRQTETLKKSGRLVLIATIAGPGKF